MMWVWAHEEPTTLHDDDFERPGWLRTPLPPTKTPLFSILRRFPASPTIKEAI